MPEPEPVPVPLQEELPVFCLCRTTDDKFFMIACDKCDEWYHPECLDLDLVRLVIISV